MTGWKTASTPAFQVRRASARAPRPKSGSSAVAGAAWREEEKERGAVRERGAVERFG
jgi:hypothetical protein